MGLFINLLSLEMYACKTLLVLWLDCHVAVGQVRQKPATAQETTADIVDWIRANYQDTDSGIIYCQTRKVS